MGKSTQVENDVVDTDGGVVVAEKPTVKQAVQPIVIKGEVQSWGINVNKPSRDYVAYQANYGKIRKLVRSNLYNVAENTGEQRAQKKAHVNRLVRAVQGDNFTPTAIYAGVSANHEIKRVKKNAEITITAENPLHLTDGGHRISALEQLRSEGGATQKLIDQLPITMMIMLNPENTVQDFINLQEGLPVEKSHLTSMKIANNLMDESRTPTYKMAVQIARLLHESSGSPLFKLVKFDSVGEAPLKLSSLLTIHASDLATSLYGSAKIALDYGKDAEWVAGIILMVYENLQAETPDLLNAGKLLCPPPEGTRGGAGLLIGLGNMMAYRLRLLDREVPVERDIKVLLKALTVFDDSVDGNFSSKSKRQLIGQFADLFFKDIVNEEGSVIASHDGTPISLLNLLSVSAFNASPLPKIPGRRGRKPKSEPVEETQVIDSENSVDSDNQDIDTDPEWTNDDEEQTKEENVIIEDEGAPWENV